MGVSTGVNRWLRKTSRPDVGRENGGENWETVSAMKWGILKICEV